MRLSVSRLALAIALVIGGGARADAQSANGGPSRNGGGPSGATWVRDLAAATGCGKGAAGSNRKGCGRGDRPTRDKTNPDGGNAGQTETGGKPTIRVRVPTPGAGRIVETTRKPVPVATTAPKKPARPATVARKTVKPVLAGAPALAAIPVPSARPALAPVLAGDHVPDEVLVTIDGGAAETARLAESFDLTVRAERQSLLLGRRVVRFGIPDGRAPELVMAALAGAPGVLTRELNHIYGLQAMRAPVSYAFERIGLADTAADGGGVAIGVIDSATDPRHPALKKILAGFHDALPDYPVVDSRHGTSVDGLIAGSRPVPGMAPNARIFHARAFENGKSTMDAILSAFDWAVSQEVRIVNMSFAGPASAIMEEACTAALARGVVLVAAAGNNGPGAPSVFPGAYPGVIAVTATNDKDVLMPQANRGDYVFVAAPGVDVVAPVPGGGADFVTGTSFSAAIVSGAIANLIAADPARDGAWVAKVLAGSAQDLGAAGRDVDFGYGLVNVGAAGKMAAN